MWESAGPNGTYGAADYLMGSMVSPHGVNGDGYRSPFPLIYVPCGCGVLAGERDAGLACNRRLTVRFADLNCAGHYTIVTFLAHRLDPACGLHDFPGSTGARNLSLSLPLLGQDSGKATAIISEIVAAIIMP